MAMAYKGSLVELPLFGTYWVYEHPVEPVYNLGSPCNSIKNVTYDLPFWLTCTEYRLVPCSPACDLKNISFFRDGNNPGKPSVLPF